MFFILFPKEIYLIKKYHILQTIFGTKNGALYLVDSENNSGNKELTQYKLNPT